jgi:hypothetical protein
MTGRERVLRVLTPGAIAVLAGALASLLLASSASADEYHVYSCRTPGGEVAPTDGWSGSVSGEFAHEADKDVATWTFTPPSGDQIAQATLWRAGDAEGGGSSSSSYLFWLAGPQNGGYKTPEAFNECVAFGGCTEVGKFGVPLDPENKVVVPSSNLGSGSAHLYLNASCESASPGTSCPSGGGDESGYAAVVDLYGADIVLRQAATPTVTAVGGGLAEDSTVTGTTDVSFHASDPGAGVYAVAFQVDGGALQIRALTTEDAHCAPLGQDGEGRLEFGYLHPCPASLSSDVQFDTTALSNGSHTIRVLVEDAAGNYEQVVQRQVTVANASSGGSGGGSADGGAGSVSGPASGGGLAGLGASASTLAQGPGSPNGVGASTQATLTARWQSTTRTTLTVGYGRAQRITGRLTASSGAPIAGAQIDATVTAAYQGARSTVLPSQRTGSDGRFTLLVPAASSCTVGLAYRATLGAPAPVAKRALTLNVHTGLSLRITPRTASVGRTITFTGLLRGGPIPAGGKQLVLEARSQGSGWVQFRVVRTDYHGHFHATYRFRLPGPVRYQFRAVSGYEADFPFTAGTSNVVAVFER